MFKLATIALIATTQATASAAKDEAAVKKEAAAAKAKMSKFKVSPGAAIWNKKGIFMAEKTATPYTAIAKKTEIEALKDDCMSCVMSGNDYTKYIKHVDAVKYVKAVKGVKAVAAVKGVKGVKAVAYVKAEPAVVADKTKGIKAKAAVVGVKKVDAVTEVTAVKKVDAVTAVKGVTAVAEVKGQALACAPPTAAKGKTQVLKTADAAVDLTLTYKDFVAGMATCPQKSGTAGDVCMVDPFDVTTFTAGKSTGKKGDAPYTWAYSWADKATEWDTCSYSAAMPSKGFSGGLLITHTLTADTQAVVQITNSGVPYLYNSYTLKAGSVGKTDKVVVPLADSIDVTMTAVKTQTADSTFKITFERQTNEQLAAFTLEHGGVIVWVIIGIVVFCLLCVGVIVWKKCFNKTDDFYVEDCYARV